MRPSRRCARSRSQAVVELEEPNKALHGAHTQPKPHAAATLAGHSPQASTKPLSSGSEAALAPNEALAKRCEKASFEELAASKTTIPSRTARTEARALADKVADYHHKTKAGKSCPEYQKLKRRDESLHILSGGARGSNTNRGDAESGQIVGNLGNKRYRDFMDGM